MGRSRGGLTSKIHAVVDTNGLPVRLALTAGEAHDNRLAAAVIREGRINPVQLAWLDSPLAELIPPRTDPARHSCVALRSLY
jgi:transposase